ncbi:WD repeat-containing protein [Canna indica]|uniref:WD repeat-containing protein n=1 Tax=Canna indica TaxID=4628 RepID=A0AAQ3KNU9_9LILI|nr:WD repeat-containing protein [Canna indica]
MPRTIAVECPGCAPLRALTTDVLGLVKVVEARGRPGILKVVETWGQPDASSSVLAASYADHKTEPLLAVARKNGLVDFINPLNGEVLNSTKIDQSRSSDSSVQDDHVAGLHLFKTKGHDSFSRVVLLLACLEKGNACLTSIAIKDQPQDSDICSPVTWNVCSAGKILCSAVDKSENYALFGGKGVELNLWDLENCSKSWTAKPPPSNNLNIFYPTWFTAATFLSEGDHRKIVAGTNNQQVRLYDTSAQRRPVISVNFRESAVRAVCEDIDGYTVYVGNGTGDLASFDMRTGKLLGCFIGKCSGSIRSIVRHPESSIIASCGLDSYLRVWDAKTRQLLSAVFLKQHLTNVVIDSHFSDEGSGGNNCDQSDYLQVRNDTEIMDDEEMPSKTMKIDDEELVPIPDKSKSSKTKKPSGIEKKKSKNRNRYNDEASETFESEDMGELVPIKRKKSSKERSKSLEQKKSKKAFGQ